MIAEGIHIQISSFRITLIPHALKKDLTSMGETLIGLHGKKYLLLSKGESNAMPRPPLVRASRMPWVAVIIKKYPHSRNQPFVRGCSSLKKTVVTKMPTIRAKSNEWKNPLCPKNWE
jgi:hypothetical protein